MGGPLNLHHADNLMDPTQLRPSWFRNVKRLRHSQDFCSRVSPMEPVQAPCIVTCIIRRELRPCGRFLVRVLPSERLPSDAPDGAAVTDDRSEAPPVIGRAEVVAFALVALLIICLVAVLYVAKAFFLPVVMAFVVGTMLSPAAS